MATIEEAMWAARNSERPPVASGKPPMGPNAGDALEPQPLVLHSFHCVREALTALRRSGTCAAVVIDGGRVPIGDFSMGDVLRVLAAGAYHQGCRAGCRMVRDVMRADPILVRKTSDAFELAQRLASSDREVAGVVEGDLLVGVVSRRSLVALLERPYDPQCQSAGDGKQKGGVHTDCITPRLRADAARTARR